MLLSHCTPLRVGRALVTRALLTPATSGSSSARSSHRFVHSSSSLSAAPAGKPAPAGKGAAPSAPTGPSLLNVAPAVGTARYMKESFGTSKLVPIIYTAEASAEEQAQIAAEAAAAAVPYVLHAQVRTETGSKYCNIIRGQVFRIPGIICDRAAPRQNQLLITIDRFEMEKFSRTFRRTANHKVVLLKIEGQEEPIKVIIDEIHRHAVSQELMVVNWFLFKPHCEKVRVNIPIVYTGTEECIGVKRGGVIVVLRDSVPCIWTGDEQIPPFIHINMTLADGGKVYRNADLNLPVGLRLFNSKFDYVLATVIGVKTKTKEVEEEVVVAAVVSHQPSAIQLEREKKIKEAREEEEMVAQKLAQAKAKGKK